MAEQLIEVTVLEELTSGGWRFAFTADTPEKFAYAVNALKAHLPPGMRRWQPEERCWWISSPGMLRLYDLFSEVREAMNRQSSARDSQGQRQQRRQNQRQQRPRSNVAPVETAEAFAVLFLLPSAPLPVIKAAYRALANLYHPDHGGTHEQMLRLNKAHETACAWANKQTSKAS